MPISPRICKSARHSCSCSFVYSVRETSTATCIPSTAISARNDADPHEPKAERATHCYIVHYARVDTSTVRRTGFADWVRMARRFVFERRRGAGANRVRGLDRVADLLVRLH